ncbi:nucleotidyltransferase family protein [Rummeliibacillus pycnus]|uniref:nucleotidyltransferase family protein n=1 Tax=Rummeliibacillus pycnus TaxID=101070 RepID=UPI003D26759F
MKIWKQTLVNTKTSILETMRIIDNSSLQFAVVVDENLHLLGTVTDGDIRRGLLNGISLNDEVDLVMNCQPIISSSDKSYHQNVNLLKEKKLRQLPIIDHTNKLVNIIFSDELNATQYKTNFVVLMAGGLGTRLRPLTDHTPKPMLNVGSKPILETIIEGFKNHGFVNFIICVNYKKEVIQNYFQDGSAFGVNIEYIEEEKRMGTAGALSLLKHKPMEPFFVMNADLLTQVNFEQLLHFHEENHSVATMCVREYEYQIPFGVIETNGQNLISIKEKPVHKNFVNAGIYILNPEVLDVIPKDQFFDMPNLFNELIEQEENTTAFPVREYWLDIGRIADYEKANAEMSKGMSVFE